MGNQQVRPVAVSTHSRLKAAGPRRHRHAPAHHGFNTQPPEGGWPVRRKADRPWRGFNTQPPEGGWMAAAVAVFVGLVSTHSRLKAAGDIPECTKPPFGSFNTQPPEGGWILGRQPQRAKRRFNTQPPEGGWLVQVWRFVQSHSFNTQPPEGGWSDQHKQHT